MSEKKLALIDGYGFVFRAYHSLPPLTRADGTPVGAVYGFTNMLIKLLASLHVSHMAVVFDAGSKTFRNEIYPAYKANRPPCPEDLIPQFSLVREAAESLNLTILEKTGVEADDIIATLAKKYAAEDFEVLIISSDKDLMQLISDNIKMYDAMKNRLVGENEVKEKFAVLPNKVLDVLALMGDSSDNIPGVKGIGPKTAAELIDQFGDLENIFCNLDKIKQDKRRQLLSDGYENAKLSKILLSLKYDVEMNIDLNDLEIRAIDPQKLIKFVEKQGFRSLLERIKKEFSIIEDSSQISNNQEKTSSKIIVENNFDEIKKIKITHENDFNKIHQQALDSGYLTVDYECCFGYLSTIIISTSAYDDSVQEIYYLDLVQNHHLAQNNDLFNFKSNTDQDAISLDRFEKILLDNSVKKIFFDIKNFIRFYHKISQTAELFDIKAFEDISLINHILNSSIKNDFSELINLNLNEDLEARNFNQLFVELDKSRIPASFSDIEKKVEFYCFKNYAIWQIYKILAPKIIIEKLNNSYQNYEKPLLPVLAKMETLGVKIDTKKLYNLSCEFSYKISELSKDIYSLAGQEFNIASPKQLGEILFEKMGLSSSKKSKKTGALSTGVGVLEELEENGYEIARKILEFRKFSKLKNTYTDALPKEIDPISGRVHTHLSSISTITGRLSSSNPNLQNIPIKSEEGRKIRSAFIAEKNHLLISADYSQIELRVIAHIAKIDTLIDAFKNDKDIHRITAAQVFNLNEADVSADLRSKAKAINFGIIYGISGFGLAKQLAIGRKEAAEYIKSYLATYPGIDIYMKNYIELARKNGYVETLGGRKCYIRGINDRNPIIRAEAERLAINAPIQGSAADIVKKAMIKLDKKLSENAPDAKMILQIHDELIIEAPENDAKMIAEMVKKEMENAMLFDCPLKVDVAIAKEWS